MADTTSEQLSHEQPTVVRLWSADNVEFQVDREVVCEFQSLRHMVQERAYEDAPIHLDRISSKLLSKVLKYCEYHVSNRRRRHANENSAEVFLDAEKAWDTEYLKVDRSVLFALLEVSLEWNIEGLLALTLSTIVKQIYDGSRKIADDEEEGNGNVSGSESVD
ncbi:S-phase kinase-associated protein 1 [Marchantia polymorpha subsp. ruderalis]|nr:hypothetical protein MARPO_0031s0183 [Marchantia polymorpha]BBN01170.1 hypothetical protein Mp_2g05290 [Marchantia polymorpha subsp. ruderalis]|eukprot:PTQ42221.1 hypothetical protein MARPO_0031s0183 [Marchantia polymorpha]